MTQAEFKKRLKALMNKPENQVCSDCPERKPTWASLIVPPPGAPPGSLPMGAFCCLECSGSHRRLGVHISFVRSVNLDAWKEKEVLAMENGGNKKVNAIFEARLPTSGAHKPTAGASGPTRERFIRDKYERRKFFDESVLQGYPDQESSSEEEEEEAPVRRARRNAPVARSAPRPPSEAARRRIESRQARMGGPAPAKARAAAPPAAAPAEVDLLDFGAFDSTPVPAVSTPAPQAPPPTSAAAAATTSSASVDLFAEMNLNGGPTPTPAPTPAKSSATTNDQILAMFSTGSGAPHQQPMMAPNNMTMMMPNMPNGRGAYISGGNMMQQPQQQMGNPMMHQQMMGNPMMPQQMMNNPMMQQQMMGNQQQQQNMLFAGMQKQQNGNMFMNMSNGGGGYSGGGRMQQPQQQMNPMMMQAQQQSTDGFGFPDAPMGSGPAIGGQQGRPMMTTANGGSYAPQQQQITTATSGGGSSGGDDPFAQFGMNAFRS